MVNKPKPKPRSRVRSDPSTPAPADPAIRVRMYRQGLGDCFLLRFRGGAHVLVDCGTIGQNASSRVTMDDVIADIRKTTGGKLQVVIATHEHDDHVSGFRTHHEQLKAFDVAESWQAWTEDAGDEQARQLTRYRGDLLKVVTAGTERLGLASDKLLRDLGAAAGEVLSFDGNDDLRLAKLKAKSNQAMGNALELGKKRVFLAPGKVLEPSWAGGARFYVLGPPRDEQYLRNMGRHGSPDLYDLTGPLSGKVDADLRTPFYHRLSLGANDPVVRHRYAAAYDDPESRWRCIDEDWLGVTADLALQLDSYTNNTSLALAIELEDKVLLFPGDAQLGSWLSWHTLEFGARGGDSTTDKVTAADLLARTVFYKVGHHSSHNATATAKGLELIADENLVAFISLDGQVAQNKKWPMPAPHLYQRLLEKARGRVIRSDVGWPDAQARPASVAAMAWRDARAAAPVQTTDLYFDYWM